MCIRDSLSDSAEARRRGWARLVLFASYLRPEPLEVPALPELLRDAFKPGLRSLKAHFGLYPFRWRAGWQAAADGLMGKEQPRLQVAPVLERLVLPRAQHALLGWLQELRGLAEMRWLVPAHYSAPLIFTPETVQHLLASLKQREWAPGLDLSLIHI